MTKLLPLIATNDAITFTLAPGFYRITTLGEYNPFGKPFWDEIEHDFDSMLTSYDLEDGHLVNFNISCFVYSGEGEDNIISTTGDTVIAPMSRKDIMDAKGLTEWNSFSSTFPIKVVYNRSDRKMDIHAPGGVISLWGKDE